jgi:hypothetical protein
MCPASKLISALFVASFFFFSMAGLVSAQEGRIYLDFGNQTLSADIEEVPLRVFNGSRNGSKGKSSCWMKRFRCSLKTSPFRTAWTESFPNLITASSWNRAEFLG